MLIDKLDKLITESRNPATLDIDTMTTLEIIEVINEEDKKVAHAVEEQKENIARAVDLIVEQIKKGGRLIYVGAGSSGRMGIMDAAECPPTYGVDKELVQGVIAGGKDAMLDAVEGAEDSREAGKKACQEIDLRGLDVVCGISASGRTPFALGAMEYAKELGGNTISISMNPKSEMGNLADVDISVIVGPEVIMGSTRMKSGSAQKMVCNMLTTTSMIKLGKVYSNLMIDVKTSNEKLVERAKRIIMLATEVDYEKAEKYLEESDNSVKLAIFMIESGLDKERSIKILDEYDGYIGDALKNI